MSRRKPPLDPEAVAASRQATLRHYVQRPGSVADAAVHLREVSIPAQLTAASLRLKPKTEAQAEAKRTAEKKYRVKKNIELHRAEIYDEVRQLPILAKTQRRHKGHAPPPRPQPTIAPNSTHREKIPEDWSEDENSEEEDLSPIPDTVFYGVHNLLSIFTSLKHTTAMCLERSWTPFMHLNCVPSYFPHSSHTHSMQEHATDPDLQFFAILDGDFAGVFTDFSQIEEILRHPVRNTSRITPGLGSPGDGGGLATTATATSGPATQALQHLPLRSTHHPPPSHRRELRSQSLDEGLLTAASQAARKDGASTMRSASGVLSRPAAGPKVLYTTREAMFELLQATSGAEMHLVAFVGEAAALFDSVAGPFTVGTIYAVSGHGTVYRSREKVFRVFLKEEEAEMLFSSSSLVVDMFIRVHAYI
ncbi:hypothetical protein B0H17DRAFT_1139451 [Mycena rosella]|uniref:Uncharacterized protein n=1 Tax=Mycena rosella TaxID=1033263 RepID=A0AAD7D463_MYCRO|nr:hypothetical protein B0H17DRAFT_1139451 [Mycena rosella]